jgi:glutamate racemase
VAVAEAGVPVVGLIDSVAATLSADRIGVLATPATAGSGAYRRAIHACNPDAEVIEVGCPAFVPLIEAGDLQHPELRHAARTYLAPLLEHDVQAIVLGCTHYPLLTPLLQDLLPAGVSLVDPAQAAVQRLGPLLASLGDLPEGEQRQDPVLSPMLASRICVTGCPKTFAQAAARWLGIEPQVEQVQLKRQPA